jgi:hypothetical protein
VDPDPDSTGFLDPGRQKVNKFHYAGCSVLKAEGFSCILDVLYGGLGISRLQYFIKKTMKNFLFFSPSIFGYQRPGS